jgi:hypothetical protein
MLKCTFSREKVEYAGHIIPKERIKANPNRVNAITWWIKLKISLKSIFGLNDILLKVFKKVCPPSSVALEHVKEKLILNGQGQKGTKRYCV